MALAPMLMWHDVIGLVGMERKPLREPTILTALRRPFRHFLTDPARHWCRH